MSDKVVIPRAVALTDVEQAIEAYLSQTNEQVALGFINALEVAYQHIGRFPETGSQRYAHELNLPGLRAWKLKRYPYLIFYVELDEHIDVWRVLHGKRDVAAWLHDPDRD